MRSACEQFLKKSGIEVPVVNIPGCPANPEWLVSVLVDVIMLDSKQLKLTSDNKPEGIFGQTIHDNCERRGHFENGEFVYKFGSEEEAKGYCLYPLGCRGPQTKSNVRHHDVEQPPQLVRAGWFSLHRLLRGESQRPGRQLGRGEHPVLQAPSRPAHWRLDGSARHDRSHRSPASSPAALVVHGFGMKATGRMDGGADFETIRKWDEDHPENSIGTYDLTDEEKAQACKENSGNLTQKERLYDTIGVRPDMKKNDTEGGQE